MIPTFDTLDELWLHALDAVLNQGEDVPSRDGSSREYVGYVARLSDPTAHFLLNPVRKLSPFYAAAELLWYLSGTSNIDRIVAYAPSYRRFVQGQHDDGINAFGAYGKRLLYPLETPGLPKEHWDRYGRPVVEGKTSQIDILLHLLRTKPESRQGVITLFHPLDLYQSVIGGVGDIPCTIALLFLVRNGKLNLSVTMRSNDLWLGTPYDIFCFTSLQILIAQSLGLQLGWYQHSAMSLHVYDRDKEKAIIAAGPPAFDTGSIEYPVPVSSYLNDWIRDALLLESHNRAIGACADAVEPIVNTLLGQMVVWASIKFWRQRTALRRVASKLMVRYIEKNFFSE